jgi:hypothetical protein
MLLDGLPPFGYNDPMLTPSHPSLRNYPRLAYALDTGKVAITFRKVTDDTMRTMVASRSPAAQAECSPRFGIADDSHRPNLALIEFLPDGSTRLRSFHTSELVSWTVVSHDELATA